MPENTLTRDRKLSWLTIWTTLANHKTVTPQATDPPALRGKREGQGCGTKVWNKWFCHSLLRRSRRRALLQCSFMLCDLLPLALTLILTSSSPLLPPFDVAQTCTLVGVTLSSDVLLRYMS